MSNSYPIKKLFPMKKSRKTLLITEKKPTQVIEITEMVKLANNEIKIATVF